MVAELSERAWMRLFRAIAAGDRAGASALVRRDPRLALEPIRVGGTRESPTAYFLEPIRRQVYAGDTALHIAAAAHDVELIEMLLAAGAPVNARNRRGASPLHDAADGTSESAGSSAAAQRSTIERLIRAGADVEVTDKSGMTPLHRAVRARCAVAVDTLLDHGANPRAQNASGSTPLRLAVLNTGRSGSGSAAARAAREAILARLHSS